MLRPRVAAPRDECLWFWANQPTWRRETLGWGFLALILLAAPPFSLAQGKWHVSSAEGIERELQLALQSKQLAGFDQGKLIKNQIFSNPEIGIDLAAAMVWDGRYPGVPKCLLLSKDSSRLHLLLPSDPDPDLPLTCTGQVAVAFVKTAPGFKVLAIFRYVSPSRASIHYPLVLDVQQMQGASVDVASTERANRARDDGRRLRSIADLKKIWER